MSAISGQNMLRSFLKNTCSSQQQQHRTMQYISLNVKKKSIEDDTHIAIYQNVNLLAIRE